MLVLAVWLTTGIVHAQTPAQPADNQRPRLELYGYAMLDMGYQFKQNDPDFFDVLRTSVLPASENAFGEDGRFFFSVRQSRLGVRTFLPTVLGELRTTFEFDLYGVSTDVGQTTFPPAPHLTVSLGSSAGGSIGARPWTSTRFRLRSGVGGPSGAVDFRNVQVYGWMPDSGRHAVDLRARETGRQRRRGPSGRIASSCRTSRRGFRCRTFPGGLSVGGTGATSRVPGSSATSSWTTCWMTVSISTSPFSGGASALAQTSGRPRRTSSTCS